MFGQLSLFIFGSVIHILIGRNQVEAAVSVLNSGHHFKFARGTTGNGRRRVETRLTHNYAAVGPITANFHSNRFSHSPQGPEDNYFELHAVAEGQEGVTMNSKVKKKFPTFKIPQLPQVDIIGPMKPLLREHISDSLKKELQVVQAEIENNFPLVYAYGDRRFRAFLEKVPIKLRPLFLSFVRADQSFRLIARAFREALLIGISTTLVTATMKPLIEGIVEAVLETTVSAGLDRRHYFDKLHKNIMDQFDSQAVDLMLDNLSRKISLISATAASAFFSLLLKSFDDKFDILKSIPMFQSDRFEKLTQGDEDFYYTQYSTESRNIISTFSKKVARFGIETLSTFIIALMIAMSAFLKPLLQLSFAMPPFKAKLKQEFELNLMRAYASMPFPLKPSQLPQAVSPNNKDLTIHNVFQGARTMDERRQLCEQYRKRIMAEENERATFRLVC